MDRFQVHSGAETINRRHFLSWILAACLAMVGLLLITLVILPYGTLKSSIELFLPDHNFNSLKPWNAGIFKALFGAGGLLFFCLAVVTILRRWKLVGKFLLRLRVDGGHFFSSLRPRKEELASLAVLLVVMVLAVVYRLEHIYSPLSHDEAYTYVVFSRSLFTAISDYHLPNNHIFHSILVYFSTQLFGIQPWAVRLPALVAGVLLVPAAYWLAKHWYDRWVALGAALLVAWLPDMVAYSDNARGYTLVALFTLLILALGWYVLKEKNLFAWGLISLFSALGLYTVPVMLFPFGILFVWLFLENLAGGAGPYHTRLEFIWHWLVSGLLAALLTLLFYLPIFIFTGPAKVFANDFVAPLPWRDLLETLSSRFSETWAEWTFRLPLILLIVLMIGWVLGLLFHWRISKIRVPLQAAALGWIAILLVVQRPNAWSKVWVFLQPLMLIWAAAGIFGLLAKARLKFLRNFSLAAVVIGLALLGEVWQAAWLAPQLPGLWARRGSDEKTVLYLQNRLQEDDLIVVTAPEDAPVWYYSELHGIPEASFDLRRTNFKRALVLVVPADDQTPASVIADRGPESVPLDVESARLLETIGKMQVFEVPRR